MYLKYVIIRIIWTHYLRTILYTDASKSAVSDLLYFVPLQALWCRICIRFSPARRGPWGPRLCYKSQATMYIMC